MASDVPIRCTCGRLRAVARGLDPSSGNRVVCYCKDCQAFAHFLGRPDELLDRHGGSDIFQTSPARVEWTEGREHLACMRLSEKGIVRWYASCCNTPIGNTAASPAMPFVGLLEPCLERDRRGGDDAVLGPVRARVWSQSARAVPGEPAPASQGLPGTILRFLRIVIGSRIRGDHRRSAFFDPTTHQPIVTPRVLSPGEREALRSAVG